MHNSARFAAVLATAALAYVPAPVAAQSCEDLILGAALSATGIYAANGNNTKNGYEFAVKKINDAGGIMSKTGNLGGTVDVIAGLAALGLGLICAFCGARLAYLNAEQL